ncbi:hypothetical protein M422DRAFT_274419 [Sphaerobolus stellatus SS14]|uniref:DUF6533 domain-containing protein n=1 Tax=Sphaerobolus stellatus (strain SS14) TaxID=990650 RepID=A0A0C9T703_SPHS4|nr:hypothetical protein M422DRAFT_274419 [Sphaerobolus stellatus SS14]
MEGPALAELFKDINNQSTAYIDVAIIALVIYDSFLTIGDEVLFIWSKKISLGSVLYLLAQYCCLH